MATPRKIRCQIERVMDHGDHVYSLELKPQRSVPMFQPGQFLHLAVDEYDPSGFWPESRVFSIASSPLERDQLVISYSVKGVYTARMERELVTGKSVWVKLPYGDFVVDGARDVVLIAGGTGITAFRAFIAGLKPDHPHRVQLLYGARRRELLLGLALIEKKRHEVSSFEAAYFSEQETHPLPLPGGVGGGASGDTPGPLILSGFVRLDVLDGCCLGVSTVYYLAGPPVMIATFRKDLMERGVAAESIRIDAWE